MSSDASPSVGREAATTAVVQAGESAAQAAGFRFVTEQSRNSESRYLHVLRHGVWYGLRVSCHQPVYDCCRDYEQLLLSESPDSSEVTAACAVAAASAVEGGGVVADPADVAVAIEKISSVLNDGRTFRDDDGLRWRWSSDESRWELACRYWGDESQLRPPTEPPSSRVTDRIRSQVRHSQNVTAKQATDPLG